MQRQRKPRDERDADSFSDHCQQRRHVLDRMVVLARPASCLIRGVDQLLAAVLRQKHTGAVQRTEAQVTPPGPRRSLGHDAPATPSLRGGTSASYLAALDDLARELAGYLILPGHGEPGAAERLIPRTRAYITEVRRLVRDALRRVGALNVATRADIKRQLTEHFDLSFDSPLFPLEHEANIDAVATEILRGQKGSGRGTRSRR